jgi:hypothetical protein
MLASLWRIRSGYWVTRTEIEQVTLPIAFAAQIMHCGIADRYDCTVLLLHRSRLWSSVPRKRTVRRPHRSIPQRPCDELPKVALWLKRPEPQNGREG